MHMPTNTHEHNQYVKELPSSYDAIEKSNVCFYSIDIWSSTAAVNCKIYPLLCHGGMLITITSRQEIYTTPTEKWTVNISAYTMPEIWNFVNLNLSKRWCGYGNCKSKPQKEITFRFVISVQYIIDILLPPLPTLHYHPHPNTRQCGYEYGMNESIPWDK